MIGPVVGIRQLDAASDVELSLSAARAQLDDLVRAQLAEETGLRGYVETRDRDFLSPDGPPNPHFRQEAATLRARLDQAGLAAMLPIIDEIVAVHDQWEREVALPLLADPRRSDAQLRETTGKLLTDRLRRASEQLLDGLRIADDHGQAQLADRIDATVAISTGFVVIFAIAAVLLGLDRSSALERLEREHLLVDALQRTLRVQGTRPPRTRIGFAYASATREALIGGDLLDVWQSRGHGWFLIADASGKGVEAARHAAFVQYAMRALAAEHDDPGTVVSRFNRLFGETFEDPGIFVVLFLGRLDARSSEVRYVSAGHSGAFVRRPSGEVEQLLVTGPVVGLDPQQAYPEGRRRLAPGETLLLVTDGLTESRDAAGEFLGDDGVATIFAHGPADPQALCDRLVDELQQRSVGDPADDLAILALAVGEHEGELADERRFSTMEADQES